MAKVVVDARGKKCPMPIIMTKKTVDSSAIGDQIEVLVDNEIAFNNVTKYVEELGFGSVGNISANKIEFVVGQSTNPAPSIDFESCEIAPTPTSDYVIVVSSNVMGGGESELGEILIRSYINVIPELGNLPKTIIFYNSGVKLVDKDSDTVASILALCEQGVEIVCCGVCVDYYKVDVPKEFIGNMFKIGSLVAKAPKVVYP